MIRRTCPAALFLLTLSGCGSEVSELEGSLLLCSDLSIQGEDDRVDFSAAVLELDPEGLDCSRGLSLETDSGEVITLGYTLLDAAGEDMSPELDLEPGDSVSGFFRSKRVWGTVQALHLEDASGLVAAMDEGTWGGGFEEGELPFSVSQTEELVAEEVSDCSTHSVYGIRFEGEDSLELLPLESGSFTAEGQTLTAMAQSSNQRGPGTSCQVSDQTNSISWAVIR